ncbi:ATP-NAD kinase-like domain-containing protein [Epithele typhae]|uniref:ATP-NAD kinase-like domain-containing protein n=1 Tax=Epithele typhae TaxID=378194 RepID=UPI002007E5A6|nr:ATP-NAD kinase-like domain-containing protein [Epithele typhae]KAH9946412.1 ATP-NAD kinase-like domain-containing protein [Epithele typhae]
MAPDPVLVVYNPVCGDRSAQAFFDAHVLPLLAQHGVAPAKVATTESPGHVGQLLVDFLAAADPAAPLSVVLGSGDGTLHELINVLHKSAGGSALPRINVALVPCGTANALYAALFPPSPDDDPVQYRLRSVQQLLAPAPRTIPLNLAVADIAPGPVATPGVPRGARQAAISAVVASTALHAAILHDSEALRATDPSMERFKTAARQNVTRWYAAHVKLYPRDGAGVVEVYDPATGTFVPHEESSEDEPIVDVGGPFAYFLSTVNVDRLEPAFRITPRGKDVLGEKTTAALDLVMIRPFRDPSVDMDSEEVRAAFAQKQMTVVGGAYQDGKHIDMRYDDDGKIVSEGTGPTVVEYIRCGRWVWEPDDIDERAHFVCTDGDILLIPKGGRAVCTAAAPMDATTGFAVYA